MKKRIKILFSIYFNMAAISICSSQYLINEEMVSIKGKIINYDKKTSPLTVQLGQINLFGLSRKHVQEIDSDGNFTFQLKVNNAQQWYLLYSEYISLIVKPGSTIFVEVDDQKIVHSEFDFSIDFGENVVKEQSQSNFFKFKSDEFGKTSSLVNRFMNKLPNEKYSYQHANDSIKYNDFNQYTEYIHRRSELYKN